MKKLRIATRQSPLALWQATHVQQQLEFAHPGLRCELVKIITQGDRILDKSLSLIGGKSLFTKELELALLDNKADLAVHSTKDLPMELPPEFTIAAIGLREDPRDVFISNTVDKLENLTPNSIIGTSSLRRQCQILRLCPQIKIQDLRGNINTRVTKLDNREYDAIILAAAGVKRLGLENRIRHYFSTKVLLPAVGQGALSIECHADDEKTQQLVQVIHHPETASCILSERAMNHRLQGSCQAPIAGYAQPNGNELILEGMVGQPDGQLIIRDLVRGPITQAEKIGIELAEKLLAQGADVILRACGIINS